MNDVVDVVNQILEIRNKLQAGDITKLTGDDLSLIAINLAGHKMTLGDYVALARSDKDVAAQTLDDVKVKSYRKNRIDGKMSIKDAEYATKEESVDALSYFNNAAYQYERLKLLHEDCESLLSAIKSRLILFQTERNEAKYD